MNAISLFYYDIPKPGGVSVFPSPVRQLRPIGIRPNQSVWWIPKHLLPYNLMHRMREKACIVEAVPLDMGDADNIVRIAREAFAAHVRHEAAKVQAVADEEWSEEIGEKTGHERDGWEADRPKRVRAAARAADKMVREYAASAEGFGLNPDEIAATPTFGQIRIITTVYGAKKVKAYGTATEKLVAKKGKDDWAAKAAARDRLPVGVMADLFREEGDDETADQLQGAFASDLNVS